MPVPSTAALDDLDSAHEHRWTGVAYGRNTAKELAKKLWFRQGTVRRSLAGPYAGLSFVIGPQMHNRMGCYTAYEREVKQLITRGSFPEVGVCVRRPSRHPRALASAGTPAGLRLRTMVGEFAS